MTTAVPITPLISTAMPLRMLAPQNISGVAVNGAWVNLRDYGHVTLLLQQGAWAGGTPAVTLQQAQDAAGTGAKVLTFTTVWLQEVLAIIGFVPQPVTGNTFPLIVGGNLLWVFELDAAALDMAGGFTWLRLQIGTPGVNADYVSAMAILTAPLHRQTLLPDGKS